MKQEPARIFTVILKKMNTSIFFPVPRPSSLSGNLSEEILSTISLIETDFTMQDNVPPPRHVRLCNAMALLEA